MSAKALQPKTDAELILELARLIKEKDAARVKLRASQLKNVRSVSLLRKEIARHKTVLRARSI